MADDKNAMTAGSFMSFQMGADGDQVVEEGTQDGLDTDAVLGGDDPEDVTADVATQDGDGGDGPEEGAGEDGPGVDEELGEFDPENVEAWDAKYQREDGTLNEEVLTKEFDANGGEGLSEDTYKYLEARGISKTFAKQVEAALKTQRDAAADPANDADVILMDVAGGPEPLKAALDWGKEGGYDKAAQDRFNKIMSGTDIDAKKEAIELLMGRFEKATTKPKPRVPARDVTKQGGSPARSAVKPFANREEYQKALKEAGDNQAKVREVTLRRKASKFD